MWPPANGSALHWIRPVKFTVTPEKNSGIEPGLWGSHFNNHVGIQRFLNSD